MTLDHSRIDPVLQIPDRAQRFEALRTDFSVDDAGEAAQISAALKELVIANLHADQQRAMRSAELALDLGEWSGQDSLLALGLRLIAQTHLICLGDVRTARGFYDRAIAIYESAGDELGRAETSLTHVWALVSEGNYDAAVQEGNWAFEVLERREQTRSLGTLAHNMAAIHHREGRIQRGLELIEQASRFYAKLGPEAEVLRVSTLIERAGVLHHLGRFSEAIENLEKATDWALRIGNIAQLARARVSLASNYQVLGWYNRALMLLELARQGWGEDRRELEVHRADFLIGHCLIQLGRYTEVIPVCERARAFFLDRGALHEAGLLHRIQAQAEIGLGQIERAFGSLGAAKEIYLSIGNRAEAASADLVAAALNYRTGSWEESRLLSLSCRDVFREAGSQIDAAAAVLLAGRSCLAAGDHAAAEEYAFEAQEFALPRELAPLNYQLFYLLGSIARARGRIETAAENFRLGLDQLEQLQRRMMVEYRPQFLEEGQMRGLFEAAVSLALERGRPLEALNLVERAKSKALFDIVANRIDLEIQARNPRDQALVDEFNFMSRERNAHLRIREQSREALGQPADLEEEERKILQLENEIMAIRERLLVRHADYAEQMEPFAPPDPERSLATLAGDTILLEYFSIADRPVVFLVHHNGKGLQVEAHWLEFDFRTVQMLYTTLRTNFATEVSGKSRHFSELQGRVQGLLKRFHDLLLGPVSDRLSNFSHVIIAPYGLLHYLPFHAFFDGERYLIEKHLVSYLPSAGFWSDPAPQTGEIGGILAAATTYEGRLPFAVEETRAISGLWGADPLLDEAATLEAVLERLAGCRLFHCASHGEFRPDSPLFSGIALADGWLTTLDIFNLKMQTSLVTLSACSTGKTAVGGGDEILGFVRAFFAAGAASLVISHWEVEDRSTALLMEKFYASLKAGETKAAALRRAQLALIQGEAGEGADRYRHPFYWAPFYLIGHTGRL